MGAKLIARIINEGKAKLTRREMLKASLTASGIALVGFRDMGWANVGGVATRGALPAGQSLGSLEFVGEGLIPMDAPMGTGLDGRLYTDLSTLALDNPVIPNDKFYLR